MLSTIAKLTVFFVLPACVTHGLGAILEDAFPAGSRYRITDECHVAAGFGGSVALISYDPSDITKTHLASAKAWTRHHSLNDFAEKTNNQARLVAKTILDGKFCLREMTSEAEGVLFGTNPGFYFRSESGHVVIVIPDEPKGTGVLFVRGR